MDNNIEHYLHIFDLYAKSNGWTLSKYAENIIKRSVNNCDGHCPCNYDRGLCPCQEHKTEIENNGMCHCTLFLKKED